MEERLPHLPIGIQYFANIRTEKSVYVDKTRYIYEICRGIGHHFLSRPRRFGKSLTLDTMAQLFKGNRALFEGLWIADKWDWETTYPVVRFSLDAVQHRDGLEAALLDAVRDQAKLHGVMVSKTASGAAFKELLELVVEKTGKQVVVLIDEYDKPIVSHFDPYDRTKAIEQRDILKNFYGILKPASDSIRFLFITGVSKFSKVSIFSDLNHLNDLTLSPVAAGLCGYTQAELEHYFKPYLDEMPLNTLEKMKEWYNGYSWDGATFMYNPFSVLNFFYQKQYRNFWFTTGTPTFLMHLLRQRFDYELEELRVSDLILDTFNLEKYEDLDAISLLLQTGYLTIKKITDAGDFILSYPNYEVKRSFNQYLLSTYTRTPIASTHANDITAALDKDDVAKAITIISNLIKAIPDQNYISNEEKFLHAIVHLIFTIINADPRSEVHIGGGRIDTAVLRPHCVFLFEFKIEQSAQAALQYIKDKNYADGLQHYNRPVLGVGVSFSKDKTKKGVADWATAVL
jgi:hypothetical protein